MSKFNNPSTRPMTRSAITSAATPSARTHEGGPGYLRGAQSELFLLAVTNMVGENTFYESADTRDTRFAALVRQVALLDASWTARFLSWLRDSANMRSAAIVGAAEYVRAMQSAAYPRATHATRGRAVVRSVLRRADEPGELLAYWMSKYGRAIPKPIKRGVADAMLRLGTEFNYIKWDSEGRGFRFADILNLTHPGDRRGSAQRIRGQWQHDLFSYIVRKPHQDDLVVPSTSPMLSRREVLLSLPVDQRREVLSSPQVLKNAGMTWESLAGWLQGPMDAHAWEAIIPSMGLFALTRNLRNFDQAGVSDAAAALVVDQLCDPETVSRSRMLPMRFLSAYREAPSLRWALGLERALNHSLSNVPPLTGRTLILVDTSTSMEGPFSKHSSLKRWDAAAVFGLALALRCDHADVVSYSAKGYGTSWAYHDTSHTKQFPLTAGESLLRAIDRWKVGGYFLGGGTDTAGAVRRHFAGHDRVVILTDEQSRSGDVGQALPATTPLYTWNLAGYRTGHSASGQANRHTFAGLTDQAFQMITLLEAGRDANWPF